MTIKQKLSLDERPYFIAEKILAIKCSRYQAHYLANNGMEDITALKEMVGAIESNQRIFVYFHEQSDLKEQLDFLFQQQITESFCDSCAECPLKTDCKAYAQNGSFENLPHMLDRVQLLLKDFPNLSEEVKVQLATETIRYNIILHILKEYIEIYKEKITKYLEDTNQEVGYGMKLSSRTMDKQIRHLDLETLTENPWILPYLKLMIGEIKKVKELNPEWVANLINLYTEKEVEKVRTLSKVLP